MDGSWMDGGPREDGRLELSSQGGRYAAWLFVLGMPSLARGIHTRKGRQMEVTP